MTKHILAWEIINQKAEITYWDDTKAEVITEQATVQELSKSDKWLK